MYPLDLVKTRFQIQSVKSASPNDPRFYSGTWDCFRKMYRLEGITSYWKGIIPPLLVQTPARAAKVILILA